ncbi:MAG: glycosyltransferase family 4 protein [Bacteroidales bacterium]|nr:glycosyltransferase family 4 protein [Candidatus Equibacterium intestinale]
MRVCYTYHCLMQKFGGISRYFYEIFKRVSATEEAVMAPRFNQNEYFKAVLADRHDLCPGKKFPGKYHLRNFLEEMALRKQLRSGGSASRQSGSHPVDIIHHTGEFPLVFLHCRKVPVVVTIHDMIPEEYHDRRRVWQRRMCVKKADHIICVSEYTRQSMLEWYPEVDPQKTSVIYHGYSFPGFPKERIIADDYLLFVGNRGGYKNFNLMLEAVAEILKERSLKLVCAGNPFTAAEKQLIEGLDLRQNVIEFGFADDEELSSLYQYASLFIFPSKLEGFGIPILEAMSHDCPICLSNASCFPEIAQDAADYFDPDSPESVAASVRKVLDDAEYRKSLVENGRARVKEFSWDKAAAETLEVYKKVLEK